MAKLKYNLDFVKGFIQRKYTNSVLLSTDYKNTKEKLQIICEKGHIINISLESLLNGNWCKFCSGKAKYTIDFVKKYIEEKHPDSIVLSKEYKNIYMELNVICENGHEFNPNFANIKNCDSWCPYCAKNKKYEMEDIISFLKINHPKAKFLSSFREKNKLKISVICENGHSYVGSFQDIKSEKAWCNKCSGLERKTIEEVKENIKFLHPGSIVLSNVYKNNSTKLKIICKNKHKFTTTWDKIKSKKWCPYCCNNQESHGESICRNLFEQYFNKPFPKSYPKWLINPKTKKLLELDGFCEELKIAFEYDGIQHYKYPNFFHKTKKQFFAQQERDQIKNFLCRKNNVKLYRIKENKNISIREFEKQFERLIINQLEVQCLSLQEIF